MSLLVNKFRESANKLKDPRAKAETAFDVGYSTGFLNFDFTNGTIVQSVVNGKKIKYASIGIVDGSISTFIGRAGCGKTSFAVQCAANIIRPYELGCIFHDDIEGGITQMRKLQLTGFTAEEIEGRYIHRNYGVSSESFYERIKMVRDLKMADREKFEYDTGLYDTMGKRIYKLQPTVYILDSLAIK